MLAKLRGQYHNTCPICGESNPHGLCVTFRATPDGAVEAEVLCGAEKEGYAGHLHGGIIASLLDGAMTNCLFSRGIAAVTGKMTLRLLQPVHVRQPIVVRGWVTKCRPPLFHTESEIRQGGRVVARASALFMQKDISEQGGRQQWQETTQICTSEG